MNDAEALVQAVAAGLGKSLLPSFVAATEPSLVRLGPETVLTRDVWLLARRELRHRRRIDTVIAWLGELLATVRPAPGKPAKPSP